MPPRTPSSLTRWAALSGLVLLCVPGSARATDYLVNSLAEPGDGTCDASECTLREAVNALSAANDTVGFDFTGVTGPYTIALQSPLVFDVDDTTLDGLLCVSCGAVQGASLPATSGFDSVLAVRIGAAPGFAGTEMVSVTAEGVVLRGVNLDGSPAVGIRITGDDALIEDCFLGTSLLGGAGDGHGESAVSIEAASGVTVGPGNVISGNGDSGITILDRDSDSPTITGNILGLDVSASVDDGNGGDGLLIESTNGALTNAVITNNVISGNAGDGIRLIEDLEGGTLGAISGNVVGTNGLGTVGIANGGNGLTFLGGSSAGTESQDFEIFGNLFSGNLGSGIFIESATAHTITSNLIGTNALGANLGNGIDGITLQSTNRRDTKQMMIGGAGVENEIAFNTGDGVRMRVALASPPVKEVKENTIGPNSFHDNGGLGIDIEAAAIGSGPLLPAALDCANDTAWGNREASAPVLSAAVVQGGVLTVSGTACAGATVDIYIAAIDPTGFGEPETWKGSTVAAGNGSFSAALPVSGVSGADFATAVQTDTEGETGEASANRLISAPCDTDNDTFDSGIGGCSGPDCDDGDPTIYPGAPEVCNGVDDDCSGGLPADESDVDSDGYLACADDCDDGDVTVNPGAAEACDGVDTNCDGAIPSDEVDDDGDGFDECAGLDCDDGDPAVFPGQTEACNGVDDDCVGGVPAVETDDDGDGFDECGDLDCDDANGAVFPGQTEACNGIDDDCDLVVPGDELDGDGDGQVECAGDCDDADANIFLGATEICDGADSDCDGATPSDELDGDGDGALECTGDDCDGEDATVYTGAPELCDGVDNDCDGTVDEVVDLDGDGVSNCDGDCDDTNAAVFPGADEVCDGLDSDCDGEVPADEQDGDGDGVAPCDGDCDDSESSVFPGAAETCEDGVDQDCDGADASCGGCQDLDDDGLGSCDGDCDDGDPTIRAGAPELCGDGVDQDCDGVDVECAELTLSEVPPAGCDCEASVGASGGGGWVAMLGLLVWTRRRRSAAAGGLMLGAAALGGCAEIGGGAVQTWWGSLPDEGGEANFVAGGGFVAGAVAQAVDPALVNGRAVVELVLAGDRHPLTCDGLELLDLESRSIEAGTRDSADSATAEALAGWACQELRGVAREVFGGDSWHAVHALLEPGAGGLARPAGTGALESALLPGAFVARVVDLDGPTGLAPDATTGGCEERVGARLTAGGPFEDGFLLAAALSRVDHKPVAAESLTLPEAEPLQVGLLFPEGLEGPAREGTVEVTAFASVEPESGYDTVVLSTRGEAIASEPCDRFSMTRAVAWPDLGAPGDDDDSVGDDDDSAETDR